MNEQRDAHAPCQPEPEPTHTERWERAVEKAVRVEKPADGWPWQKPKGKKGAGDGA